MSTQLSLHLSDICARKHQGNRESVAAFQRGQETHTRDREHVLTLLVVGPLTSKEIAVAMGKDLNCISGRISELKRDGLIVKTDSRRDGCAVLKLNS